MKFDDYLNEQIKDPEFKAEWDKIQSEMEKIKESLKPETKTNLKD